MNQRYVDELRQKYIKNPPEGMTPKLVKDMTDSDLLDMHYFMIEDDDLDDDEWEKGFYIDYPNHRLFSMPCFGRAIGLHNYVLVRTFLIKIKRKAVLFI